MPCVLSNCEKDCLGIAYNTDSCLISKFFMNSIDLVNEAIIWIRDCEVKGKIARLITELKVPEIILQELAYSEHNILQINLIPESLFSNDYKNIIDITSVLYKAMKYGIYVLLFIDYVSVEGFKEILHFLGTVHSYSNFSVIFNFDGSVSDLEKVDLLETSVGFLSFYGVTLGTCSSFRKCSFSHKPTILQELRREYE